MTLVVLLLLFSHNVLSPSPPPDTTHVSAIGTKLFLRGSARFQHFILLRLESSHDAQRAIQFVSESSASGNPKYQSLLSLVLREIDRRNYANENCYLLFSPRTYDLFVNQPFRLGGSTDLIFGVETMAQKEREAYTYVRVLVTPKSESNLRVYVRTDLNDIRPSAYQGAP